MLSFTLVTIATNDYKKRLEKLLQSADFLDLSKSRINWVIYTDNPLYFENIKRVKKFNIDLVTIPNYGWPEATLLRYEIFCKNRTSITGDYVIYLDADMEIMADFLTKLEPINWKFEAALVLHPGYWRPDYFASKFKFYIQNPRYIAKDLNLILKYGALGTWENRHTSHAFVSRKLRRKYYCGGTWIAGRTKFFEICEILSENVKKDLDGNLVAIWHDESHLNQWASSNPHESLSPSFCFDSTYPAISKLPNLVRAINKGEE